MKMMMSVLKNNFYRLMERKSRVWLCFGLTLGAALAALFLNTTTRTIGKVAVVADNPTELSSPNLNITYVKAVPPLSQLVLSKYDAIITQSEEGGYKVETIKSEQFRRTIEEIIANPSGYSSDSSGARQIGTSIVGFLMMFILMQGVSTMYLFAEDKEREQIKRIASSPVSFTGYLLGHSIFTFLFLLLPSLLVICFIKYVCRIWVGFGFFEYLFLLTLICMLAAAFSLFLQAFIKSGDSANMIGSAIVILTSILAGSFYSFEENNQALSVISKVLPQKLFLTAADLLEKGSGIQALFPYIFILALLSIFFFFAAVGKTRGDYWAGNRKPRKGGA